jgi:ABC-type transporter Mla subunit MlaD
LNGWLAVGIDFLSNNSVAIFVAAGVILIGAMIGYLVWFRPAAKHLERTLKALAKALEVPTDGWSTAKEQARNAAKTHAGVRAAWLEMEERIVPFQMGQRIIHVMFGAPRDLWSEQRLLSRSINLPLAEAVPNLLVGIGLLFTFFFLTLALTQATAALLPHANQAPTDLTNATRGLLSAAGAKFLTSLAGLLASIVWTIAARGLIARLHNAAQDVLERIGRLVPTGGGEMVMFAQLQAARELQQAGLNEIEIAKELSTKAGDQLSLTEELLKESRDQTGTLKRFETDLAISLAGAITSAFSPQMEAMTSRMIEAINGLSDKIGTMNQEALQKMMGDFAGMLKQATDTEMTQLRETMEALATRLTGAGAAIGDGAGRAAQKLDQAGADLMARVEQISQNLAAGAVDLQSATHGFKDAMIDLNGSISQASELGRQGSNLMRGILETADGVVGRLQSTTDNLTTTGHSLQQVSAQMAVAIERVEELTREQQVVVGAVRDATPQALASVQRVLDLLQQTVQQTATMMGQTKESMASTSQTLGTTVAQITEGITEYSNMVAELHRKMDEQMAKAVGSLDKGVVGLEEAVEELGEMLSDRLPRI